MVRRVSDEQILDAVLAVLARDGLAAATTRRIAEVAEVNEVTLFRRFGSKAELLRAVFSREADAFVAVGLEPTGDVRQDLSKVVETYTGLVDRLGGMIPGVVDAATRDPELLGLLEEPRRMMMAVAEMIAHYQASGELLEEPPLSTVAALLAPIFLRGLVGPALPATDAMTVVDTFLSGRGGRGLGGRGMLGRAQRRHDEPRQTKLGPTGEATDG